LLRIDLNLVRIHFKFRTDYKYWKIGALNPRPCQGMDQPLDGCAQKSLHSVSDFFLSGFEGHRGGVAQQTEMAQHSEVHMDVYACRAKRSLMHPDGEKAITRVTVEKHEII